MAFQCLGESGIVRRVGSNGVAAVEVNRSKWTWNVQCLRLIAKAGGLCVNNLYMQCTVSQSHS